MTNFDAALAGQRNLIDTNAKDLAQWIVWICLGLPVPEPEPVD
jgi:hypothetical protein